MLDPKSVIDHLQQGNHSIEISGYFNYNWSNITRSSVKVNDLTLNHSNVHKCNITAKDVTISESNLISCVIETYGNDITIEGVHAKDQSLLFYHGVDGAKISGILPSVDIGGFTSPNMVRRYLTHNGKIVLSYYTKETDGVSVLVPCEIGGTKESIACYLYGKHGIVIPDLAGIALLNTLL